MSMEPEPEGKVVHKRVRRSWISSLPLLIIPLLAYVGFAAARRRFRHVPLRRQSAIGGRLAIAFGDILLVVALGLLFFEILKATRTGGPRVDHAFSMIVFVVCLILFLIWDRRDLLSLGCGMLMAIDAITRRLGHRSASRAT